MRKNSPRLLDVISELEKLKEDYDYVMGTFQNDFILKPVSNENGYNIHVNHSINRTLFATVVYNL